MEEEAGRAVTFWELMAMTRSSRDSRVELILAPKTKDQDQLTYVRFTYSAYMSAA